MNYDNLNVLLDHDIKSCGSSPHSSFLTGLLKEWCSRLSMFASVPIILTSQADHANGDVAKNGTVPTGTSLRLPDQRTMGFDRPTWMKRQSGYRAPSGKLGTPNLVSLFTGTDDCPGKTIPTGLYTSAAPYQDSGDTTGANNTVTRSHYIWYHYYWYDTQGPDHIYSFSLVSRDDSAKLVISTTSPTYKPALHITEGTEFRGCLAGTAQTSFSMHAIRDTRWGSGNTDEIDLNWIPLNTQLYAFVDSRLNDAMGSGAYTLRLEGARIEETGTPRKRFDFDKDNKADVAIYRPTTGTWWIDRSSESMKVQHFGLPSDKIAPGDFDGDGETDIAVFRDGQWWWINSSTDESAFLHFGLPGDVPVPADYTGDGRDEIAIFRGGVWWFLDLSNNQHWAVHFGLPNDKPVPADYDGDGKKDMAVFRNGQWHLNGSRRGYRIINWGLPGDIPVIGNYDFDDWADIAVYRNGQWWVLFTNRWNFDWYRTLNWGLPNDIPVPADYNGDGYADAAVYRDGVWWIRDWFFGDYDSHRIVHFGLPGDKPASAAYLP